MARKYTVVYLQRMNGADVYTIGGFGFAGDEVVILPAPGFENEAADWSRRLTTAIQHGTSPREFYEAWDERNGVTYGFGPPDSVKAGNVVEATRQVMERHPEIGSQFNWATAQAQAQEER